MIHTESGYGWSYIFQKRSKNCKIVNSWTSNHHEWMLKAIFQLSDSDKKKIIKKNLKAENMQSIFFKVYTVFNDKLSLPFSLF